MDKIIIENSGGQREERHPSAIFNNENSAFIIDDKCYVLVNKGIDGIFRPSHHLFEEAIKLLGKLT